MRGVVLLVVGLIVCAAGASWLLDRGAGGAPVVTVDSGPVEGGPGGGARGEDGAADRPASGQAAASVQSSASPSADPPERVAARREPGDTDAGVPIDARWFELTVVDAASGAPQPGADVRWGRGLERDLPGWNARSDVAGVVRLHAPARGTVVVTAALERDGRTLFGRGRFDPELVAAGRDRIELREDVSLQVRVRDANGELAAGVPVAVRLWREDEGRGVDGASIGETDAQGLVTLQHAQLLQRWPGGDRLGLPVAQWQVAPDVPGSEHAGVLVDAQRPPREPVELRLAPSGSVRVAVTLFGAPVADPEVLTLRFGDGELHEPASWTRARDDDGAWSFAHLPLGRRFEVGASSWHVAFAGPTRTGQRVDVAIEMSEHVHVLTGRLVDERGAPFASTQVLALYDVGSRAGSAPVHTDADGRFEWVFGAIAFGEPELRRLRFEHRVGRGAEVRACDVAPRRLVTGRNDLGSLQLTSGPLVVSGWLTFDCGERRDVQLSVQVLGPAGDGWRTARDVRIVIGDDGAFSIHGAVGPGRLRLVFASRDCVPPAPVGFGLGQRDVRVEIACGYELATTCLLPDRYPSRELEVRLVPIAGAASGSDAPRLSDPLRGTLQPDGELASWRWRSLPSGRFDLTFGLHGAEPLYTIDDVHVPPPPAGDPRLVRVDLRTVLELLEVVVRDPDGEPIVGGALVFPMPQKDDALWRGTVTTAPVLQLPVDDAPLDLVVAAYGFRPNRLVQVQGRVEVTLEPWPLVELRFEGLDDLPRDVRLIASATPRGPAASVRLYDARTRSGSLLPLLEPVYNQVRVTGGRARLPITDGDVSLSVQVLVGRRRGELRDVTVGELRPGGSADVRLSRTELERLVAELRQRDS